MNCRMPSGSRPAAACSSRCWAGSGWTTARCSTGPWGSSAPGPLGGTYPSGTVRGPHRRPGSAGGYWAARASGCCGPPGRGRTPPGTSTGPCRPTPPSSVPASTTPGPETRAPRLRARTLQRWPHQLHPCVRCRGASARSLRVGRPSDRGHGPASATAGPPANRPATRANAGFEPSARRPASVMTSAPGQRRSPAQGMTR